jgi:hypothetical protein
MKNRESYIARVSIIYEPCVKRPIVSLFHYVLNVLGAVWTFLLFLRCSLHE